VDVLNSLRRKLLRPLLNDLQEIRGEQTSTNRRILARLDEIALASSFASRVGFSGDHSNDLYRSLVGSERALASRPATIPLASSLCQQVYFTLDQYRYWAAAIKGRPRFMRKQWEFFFIAQTLFERGLLQPGKRGLAFGVGLEPLPALFASFGVEIVATDQSFASAEAAGWVKSSEHSTDLSGLNNRGICTDRMFSQLVSFAEVDMNAIPDHLSGFDFCWSACSLEHLGSLRHGLDFIKNSIGTLRPGGVAVHTTEFNLSSDDATVENDNLSVYRRQDVERLTRELAEGGHSVEPVDWEVGGGFAETVVDLPPWGRGEPHLRLLLDAFACTSIGLTITRGAI
jgi:SAM-dependent methyltransferase